jgi:hypothetical protein
MKSPLFVVGFHGFTEGQFMWTSLHTAMQHEIQACRHGSAAASISPAKDDICSMGTSIGQFGSASPAPPAPANGTAALLASTHLHA